MSRFRVAALISIGTGIAAGALIDATPRTVRPQAGRYVILEADLHVHSFPGDGALPPWEVTREASTRGLDIIVVSNHNQTAAAFLAARTAASGGPIVLIGQEITTPRFHMIAAGITTPVDWRLSAENAVRAVHAQGGVAIAAHPVAASWRPRDEEASRLLDGVEIAHPIGESSDAARAELRQFFDRVRAVNASVAPIGSSDFHIAGPMGRSRTYVFTEEVSARGVLDAIREGRTVARDSTGNLFGSAEHVEAIRDRRIPLRAPSRWNPVAALSVLLGLMTLVLLK